jgi:hypothetical protein
MMTAFILTVKFYRNNHVATKSVLPLMLQYLSSECGKPIEVVKEQALVYWL